jgi:serine/threonine protein kinase
MTPRIQGVELGEPLGEGSFGVVYRARHQLLDVDVAVKVIDSTRIPDPAGIDLAIAEARLMARLDHPNLLRIFDAGRAEHLVYLTLELMDGTCEKLRRVPAETAVDCSKQLLGGLQALHDARIIHRDIKPANCLLRSRDQRVKLADLGIAVTQATRTKHYNFAGTLPFMPPEAFEEPPQFGPRSDLYALGMTLTCMFLDADPFPVRSQPELLAWIMAEARPRVSVLRADIPASLGALVERMIARDPRQRPASAAEALVALSRAIQSPNPALAETVPARQSAPDRIGPWLVGERVYTSVNWMDYAVTHAKTGAPGRLGVLLPSGSLAQVSQVILGSAERASSFRHPGIVDVLDWGTFGERTFVVTAAQGRTIDQLVQSQGALDEHDAITFAASIADALTYLHAKGLVYQTVDPGSAVISADARSAQLAWPLYCVPAGSPATDADNHPVRVWVLTWAPPEVIFEPHKGEITEDVDLYGLGETLYFMLAGKGAFEELPTPVAVGFAKTQGIRNMRERLPDVTGPTAALITRLLNPEPRERPKSASEVRDELRRIAERLSPAV